MSAQEKRAASCSSSTPASLGLAAVERLPHQQAKLVRAAQRFAQVVERSEFHRLHRRSHRAEPGNHDDRSLGHLLLPDRSTSSPSAVAASEVGITRSNCGGLRPQCLADRSWRSRCRSPPLRESSPAGSGTQDRRRRSESVSMLSLLCEIARRVAREAQHRLGPVRRPRHRAQVAAERFEPAFRVIASPRPVPEALVVKNGSNKRCPYLARGCPARFGHGRIPLRPMRRTSSRTSPAGSSPAASTALRSRFSSACWSSRGSVSHSSARP